MKVTNVELNGRSHKLKGWQDGSRLNNSIKKIIKSQMGITRAYFEFSHSGKTFSVVVQPNKGSGREFAGTVSYEPK